MEQIYFKSGCRLLDKVLGSKLITAPLTSETSIGNSVITKLNVAITSPTLIVRVWLPLSFTAYLKIPPLVLLRVMVSIKWLELSCPST